VEEIVAFARRGFRGGVAHVGGHVISMVASG
jgi:hypothetical protein